MKQLILPKNITYHYFLKELPTEVTIINVNGKTYAIDIQWSISVASFENYKSLGTARINSDFFTLPKDIANTTPSAQINVPLTITFE